MSVVSCVAQFLIRKVESIESGHQMVANNLKHLNFAADRPLTGCCLVRKRKWPQFCHIHLRKLVDQQKWWCWLLIIAATDLLPAACMLALRSCCSTSLLQLTPALACAWKVFEVSELSWGFMVWPCKEIPSMVLSWEKWVQKQGWRSWQKEEIFRLKTVEEIFSPLLWAVAWSSEMTFLYLLSPPMIYFVQSDMSGRREILGILLTRFIPLCGIFMVS